MILYTVLMAIAIPLALLTIIANVAFAVENVTWSEAKSSKKPLYVILYVWSKSWLYIVTIAAWLGVSYLVAKVIFGGSM